MGWYQRRVHGATDTRPYLAFTRKALRMSAGAKVKLNTSDNEEFEIEKAVATRSVLIKNMLEDIGDSGEHPIPLPNVSSNVLKKVR